MSPGPPQDPLIGTHVGAYLITEAMGPGGPASRLYRAEDGRLARTVVLRVFSVPKNQDAASSAQDAASSAQDAAPTARDGDLERSRRRFVRQAKAASSLDHPNICSVFEIGETAEGRLFTVLPFYDGEDFAQLSARGVYQPRQVVGWAAQIARGLGKAHGEDFLHGNLRPENLMLTSSGVVKILDLGMTLHGRSAGGPHEGDDPYRAPEQQRGDPTVQATDQWALARLVRHLLTGSPLPGATEPTPPDLAAVLRRAENDAPEARYADVETFVRELARACGLYLGDIRTTGKIHLRELREAVAKMERDTEPRLPARLKTLLPALFGVVLALAVLFFQWRGSPVGMAEPVPTLESTVQISRGPGLEKSASWSPDGRLMVYASDEDGDLDILLRRPEDLEGVVLTADYTGYDDHPIFTPDGMGVVYVSDRGGGGIFRIGLDGEPIRRLATLRVSAGHDSKVHAPTLAFAPDDGELIFAATRIAPGLFRLPDWRDASPGPPVPIELQQPESPFSLAQPSISPDGRRIAFTELTGTGTSVTRLWHVARDGSDPVLVTEGDDYAESPVWSADGRSLYFLSDRNGNHGLLWQPLGADGKPDGEPGSVTVGIDIGSFALTRNRDRLIYSKTSGRSNVWSLPVDRTPQTLAQGTQLTSENHLIEFVDVSRDGQWLAFDSDRGGNVDIWLLRLLDKTWRRLTTHPSHDWRPRFSPDGRRIVFYSLRSGRRNLWVIDFEGGPARRLTDRDGTDWMPAWSPDGRFVVFDSDAGGVRSVWRVEVDGGKPRRVTPESPYDAMYPLVSPDGDKILYTQEFEDFSMGLFRIGLDGGTPEPVLGALWASFFPLSWQEDDWVYGLARPTSVDLPTYWAVHLETGETRRLVDPGHPSQELVEGFAVHEKTLYFPLWELRGDLWMAEVTAAGS